MTRDLTIELPDALLEAIAERAAEIAVKWLTKDAGSLWLSGAAQAAEYLGWPRERVYKRLHDLPHYRDEGRLMFDRRELDRFVQERRE